MLDILSGNNKVFFRPGGISALALIFILSFSFLTLALAQEETTAIDPGESGANEPAEAPAEPANEPAEAPAGETSSEELAEISDGATDEPADERLMKRR